MQDALRLAEGVAEQHAGPPGLLVVPPPLVDTGEDLRLGLPAVDRQTEGRLGDEGMATHRLEGITGAIRLDLVVARSDPDFAAVLEAHLGRAQHVAGGVKTQGDAVMVDGLAIGQGLQVDVTSQARAQNALARRGGQVMGAAGTRMVAMAMGDDGALDGAPGVDIEISGRTIQAFGPCNHQIQAGDLRVGNEGDVARCGGRATVDGSSRRRLRLHQRCRRWLICSPVAAAPAR